MNLSDPSDEELSSESSAPAAKRQRTDTLGASSTNSDDGSGGHESDEEVGEGQGTARTHHTDGGSRARLVNYKEGSAEPRSSISENCSSPGDERPAFADHDLHGPTRSSFGDDSNKFYDKSSDEGPSDKLPESNAYANHPAMRMMNKMGYRVGKGLGKYEHGRTEPVEASTQKGRRGLGLQPSKVGPVPADFKWSPDDSKPEAKEEVAWMPKPPDEPPSADELDKWLGKGPKKLTIDDETEFCNEAILRGVIEAKNVFDTLDAEDLRKARFRSNPYETIGSLFFLNRAAVKMANMDAIFDFMFTSPRNEHGQKVVERGGLLYFADVCAGPGGFSEYVLYRKKWKAKGFGFTLKGSNDFKLSDFYAGPAESFSPYYGVEGDGDIFNPANLDSLKYHVLKQTDDKGVHFLMADGGFSVEGQENIQEILSKQLYLCQCVAALMLVRTGGHFLVKLFDVFTPFSVGLVYLMYRCFEKVSIHKPVTSRPANSERYLVCINKRGDVDAVERHLLAVNSLLWSQRDGDDDVTELVPHSVLQSDEPFYNYIYNSNCVIGERQIKNLLKIAQFAKDKNLKEPNQAEMKKECLKLWKLPDEVRTQPQRLSPDETLSVMVSLMKRAPPNANNLLALKTDVLGHAPHVIAGRDDLRRIRSVYDWHFQFLFSTRQNNECKWFLGAGGNQVYQLNGSQWRNAMSLHITMPARTLIYAMSLVSGQVVKELSGEGAQQTHTKALHIMDAVCLGGIDVSHFPLTERLTQCEMFCTALNKPFEHQVMAIRSKRLHNLEDFARAFDRLDMRLLKIGQQALTVEVPSRIDRQRFHVVGSLAFFKEVKEPFEAAYSRSQHAKYYFKVVDGKICSDSDYRLLPEACMDTVASLKCRMLWYWEPASAVFQGLAHEGLKRSEFEEHILCKSKPR